ncbi:ATP-binding protein [Carbonactinospora thermoautotrophica]|uniref:ATP-binding protein n=1 Tax=Carbonactinospora thermoautotrophica TaxID=1469144 RepID=UPI00226D6E8C|nr:ATP-binding protein [Carbonactinospora thermoautotrophica]
MTAKDQRAAGDPDLPDPHPARSGRLGRTPAAHQRIIGASAASRHAAAARSFHQVAAMGGVPVLARWTLPAVPGSVRQARQLTGEIVECLGLPRSVRDNVQLLTSELVTNAVLHGEGPVRIELVIDSAIICRVTDGLPTLPRLRNATLDDETGRGLLLLEELTDDWGSERTAEGKVVWFRLDLPPQWPESQMMTR